MGLYHVLNFWATDELVRGLWADFYKSGFSKTKMSQLRKTRQSNVGSAKKGTHLASLHEVA